MIVVIIIYRTDSAITFYLVFFHCFPELTVAVAHAEAGLHPGQASSLMKDKQPFAFTLHTTCSQFLDVSTSAPLLSSAVVSTGANTVPSVTILIPASSYFQMGRAGAKVVT